MYAIIADGGRQYKVEEGQEVEVDFRELAKEGDELTCDRVLAVGGGGEVKVGTPQVEGVSVSAEVLGVAFGDKLTIQKFRKRKNSRRRTGHRQMHTRVRINKITT